jgi:hypothetical protein
LLNKITLMWYHTLVIPTLGRLKQEDHEFEASLGYVASLDPKIRRKHKIKKPF